MAIEAHVHASPVFLIAGLLFVIAALGTLHLLALGAPDSRAARAFLALGF